MTAVAGSAIDMSDSLIFQPAMEDIEHHAVGEAVLFDKSTQVKCCHLPRDRETKINEGNFLFLQFPSTAGVFGRDMVRISSFLR